jgi:flagellar hook-associated protein 3 FlgL
MRISTSSFYASGVARINDLQSSVAKIQDQIASGKRIQTASDDPIAAARVIELSQSQSQNAQFAVNRRNVSNAMTLTDSVLDSTTSALQNIQDLTLTAGGGIASDSDRKALAMAVNANLEQLLSLANSTDAEGNAMFAGYKTSGPAFTKTATGATYNGDQGHVSVQVDTARQMSINNNGDTIFQPGGTDLFKTLTDLVNLLNTPTTTAASKAALTAGLKTAADGVAGSLDSVILARTTIGSNLKALDALDAAGATKDLNFAKSISELQDLDYNAAATQLLAQKTMLDAAQASFVKIAGLSLFNYIS